MASPTLDLVERNIDTDDSTKLNDVEKDDDSSETRVPDTPPDIRLPCCPIPFKTIEVKRMSTKDIEMVTDNDRCKQLVARLQKEKIIAMAAEGINIGKEGPVTLIQIGTCSGHVFIFDILQNLHLIDKGRLRFLLQDENVMKVVHDCSAVCAALTYQFATNLTNVFDTQIAHLIIQEHKGRRLPSGIKLSEICLQYSEDTSKFFTYDWRTNSKAIWMAMMGNFWALRPLTPEMIEFAAGDVIVLIPNVYRHQSDYIDDNGLRTKFKRRVEEWMQIETNDVVRETHGKRIAIEVDGILRDMDAKYGDKTTLFNILDPDEMRALGLATYEDACNVSETLHRLKTEHILADISEIELQLRSEAESWERRENVTGYLRYYMKMPDESIKAKAGAVLKQMNGLILDHVEEKYAINSTANMLSKTEIEAITAISYEDIAAKQRGPIITALYWRLMQEEIHGMINFLRFSPSQFSLTEDEYTKVVYFSKETNVVPNEVSSLASGLLHAIRAYSAENAGYAVDTRRRSGNY
ncbi:hypothetical protein ACF0H5_012124 [Mactra antiquata]